jgi:uncharacterized protein with FMN-binding domain
MTDALNGAAKRAESQGRVAKPSRFAALALLAGIACTALSGISCALPDIRVDTPVFSGLANGAYRGSYDGGMVKAEVEVTIDGGAIAGIEILRHDCGTGKPAERIVSDVVAAQSLDVDVVSGATHSSKVILKAIETALTQAL